MKTHILWHIVQVGKCIIINYYSDVQHNSSCAKVLSVLVLLNDPELRPEKTCPMLFLLNVKFIIVTARNPMPLYILTTKLCFPRKDK